MSKFRNKLGDGTVPSGDKAYCVHCDTMHTSNWADNPNYDPKGGFGDDNNDVIYVGPKHCNPKTCDCKCHTKLRRPNCLCAVLAPGRPEGCCRCCGCKCHTEERKKAMADLRKKWKNERRAEKAAETRRKKKEGVELWEKSAFLFVIQGENEFSRQYFFDKVKDGETRESAEEFIARVRQTPWGKQNYRSFEY